MANKTASQKWLARANDDLSWTRANLREKIYFGACFTAQQTVEKALKAFLLANGRSVAKVHDLSALVEECVLIDKAFETQRETVIPLLAYYLQSRYPDIAEFTEFNEEKAKDALKRAEALLEFVKEKIN